MKHISLPALLIVLMLVLVGCLDNPAVVLTCTGWTFTADEGTFWDDNTGSNVHAVSVRVHDGDGNLIYLASPYTSGPVGTTISPVFGSDSYTTAPASNPLTFELYSPAGGDLATEIIEFSSTQNCSGQLGSSSTRNLPTFSDTRINNWDAAAPVVVYPHFVDGGVGLVIYNPDGQIIMTVSPQQIADTPEYPDQHIVVAQADGVVLYRLTDGKWQIRAPQYNGKTYVMTFENLFASGGYQSFEMD